jgi:esterase
MKKERDHLFFESFGSHEHPPVILIHGLFGSWENLKFIAKNLDDSYFVVCPDCRNHGRSFHHSCMSYDDMASDIEALIRHLNLSDPIIIGHSMGGKIAMRLSLKKTIKIKKLIVIDIAPKKYPPHHLGILNALHALNLKSIKTRSQAVDALSKDIPSMELRQFLVKNIERSNETLMWKINLDAIFDQYLIISDFPDQNNTFHGPCLFIRGTRSNYIKKGDEKAIQELFSHAVFLDIEASHWVHAENPKTTLSTIQNFLSTP